MLSNSAQGSQKAATEAICVGLWAPRGGSGTRLGRVRDAPRDTFGAKFDPKLDDFAASVFESVLLKFFSNFLFFLFLPTLSIYCNFQWNLQVFRFGPFQKHV